MTPGATIVLDGRASVTLDDVIFEEIASRRGGDVGGSGVNVHLSLTIDAKTQAVYLNQLSEGYESQSCFLGSGYRLELLDVVGYEQPTVRLRAGVASLTM